MTRVQCPRCFHTNTEGEERCAACNSPLPRQSHNSGNAAPEASDAAPRPVTPANEPFVQFQQGQVVANRYTVHNIIGRGGMGCIYKVHDNVLGEFVALKTLLPQYGRDKLVLERFFNEARIARRLAHPNIVRVHDIGKANDIIYISMECVEGKSLRAILEQAGPGARLPLPVALKIFDALCAALEYAHRYTIHRDIKPENVMLDQNDVVKLMDFGISKLMADQHLTGASLVMGTPFYMSPEQMKNSRDVDARADVYSVGVMLYEVLSGRLPTGVAKPISQLNRDIPPEFDQIVERCVEEHPAKRFQNITELRMALREAAQRLGHPLGAMADTDGSGRWGVSSEGASTPQRRSRITGGVLAALILLLCGSGLYAIEHLHARLLPSEGVTPAQAGSEFDRVARDIGAARTIAARFAAHSSTRQAIYDQAESAWESAQTLRREDTAAAHEENNATGEALKQAHAALQSFMATVLLPESMVWVPAGEVVISGIKRYVPGFFIDQYEVTLAEYNHFCENIENGWSMPAELAPYVGQYGDYPMVQVSFFDAQAYAAWNNALLPTELQWSRAAFGEEANARNYPWGESWQSDAAATQGVFEPVGSFPDDHTWAGCYDMAGNVSEWTRTPAQPETTHEDNTTPYFGTLMLVKGGNYLQAEIPLPHAQYMPFESRTSYVGFRCVREVDTGPEAVASFLTRYRDAEPPAEETDETETHERDNDET